MQFSDEDEEPSRYTFPVFPEALQQSLQDSILMFLMLRANRKKVRYKAKTYSRGFQTPLDKGTIIRSSTATSANLQWISEMSRIVTKGTSLLLMAVHFSFFWDIFKIKQSEQT